MDGALVFTNDEVMALAQAIEAAEERGDNREAIRLSSLPWAEVRHWLDAQGYARIGGHTPEDEPRQESPAR
jgi:hypothetical protein